MYMSMFVGYSLAGQTLTRVRVWSLACETVLASLVSSLILKTILS